MAPRRRTAAVAVLGTGLLLVAGTAGCGVGSVSVEQEAAALVRTCDSLQLRSAGRVVRPVGPEAFVAALSRPPGEQRDRLIAQVLKDRCRPPAPTPTLGPWFDGDSS